MELACNTIRIFAVEQKPQRFVLSGHVLLVEQAGEQRLLALQRRFARMHLGAQRVEPPVDVVRLARKLPQAAVRVRNGAFRRLEGICRLGARLFGVLQLFLQRLDFSVQFVQVLPGVCSGNGTGGR